jgi:EmrB/QacA subfamily drug resistance transporter
MADTPVIVDRRAWLTLAVASIAGFMVSLEITIISLAFRKIAAAFPETSTGTLSWVFTAYNIGVASLLLISGWLSDTRGRKRCFLAGLTIFGIGSLVSGLSVSAAMLIAGRVVQSVGGSLLFPAGLALVLTAFPPERRQAAVGIWGISGGLAAAVGPTFGAMLVNALGWRAVFLINVPVAFAGVPFGWRIFQESRAEGVPRDVDLIGIPMASLAVGALVLAIVQGEDWGYASGATLATLAVAVVLAAAFVVRALRHPAPLFDVGLYRIRSFAVANVGAVLFAIAFFGWLVQLPNFLQSQWDYSVLRAGFGLAPGPALTTVLTPLIGRFVEKVGHRLLTTVCSALGAIGLLWPVLFANETPNYVVGILPSTLLMGVSASTGFAIMVGASMRDIPPQRFGMAGAGRTTAFQLAVALGVAISVAIVGRPQSDAVALDHHRTNWLVGAGLHLALAVLFLLAYPRPSGTPAAGPAAVAGAAH